MPSINTFWSAAAQVDPSSENSEVRTRSGGSAGDLGGLLRGVGLAAVDESSITARTEYAAFDAWWTPFTGGVGPIGSYVQSLTDEQRDAIRATSDELLGRPREPFSLEAHAWYARGTT